MNYKMSTIIRIGIVMCVALALMPLAGCSIMQAMFSKDGSFRIIKVNRSLNKDTLRDAGFETAGKKQLLSAQTFDSDLLYEEQGEEFIVIWRYDGPVVTNVPVKLYFDYNYAGESEFYRVTESYDTVIPGRHEFLFRNVGDNFFQRGSVEHWRVSIYYGSTKVAGNESVFFVRK